MLKNNKIFILTLFLLCALILCSCFSQNNNNTQNIEYDISVNASLKYTTFEEYLSLATNIVSATYTGNYTTTDAYQDLVFTPISQIKGNNLVEDFHIRIYHNKTTFINGTNISYTSSPTLYTAGETYILVLERRISVYQPYDIYLPLGNIRIVDSANATMYNNADIAVHSNSKDAVSAAPSIVSYINDYVKNDTHIAQPTGREHIRSTDLNNIVSGSSIIAKVTPIKYVGGSQNNDTDRYLCTVDSVIKGDLSQETVTIIFISDTVTVNSQYVVMIEQLGTSTFYTLSSRNSVYPVNNSDIVQQVEEAMAVK